MSQSPALAPDTDAYYVNLFVENPAWSAPQPNDDESARWTKISTLLQSITAGEPADKSRRILDVGCGRGWLTSLASEFGECEGVEPVAPVVIQARQLFPNLRFTAGDADTILAAADFEPYDFVLTSEVIEHVPRTAQADFVRKLARLLKPGGHVILTTPRGESLQEWTRLAGDPSQPVEEWLREPQLRQLFLDEQFIVRGHERVWFDTEARRFVAGAEAEAANALLAIYQVWAFQLPENQTPPSPSPLEAEQNVLAEYYSVCRDAAERALQQVPDHPALLSAQASALLNLGDFEAARRLLIRTVALNADNAPARRLFAEVLWRCGRPEDAEAQMACVAPLEAAAKSRCEAKNFSFLKHLKEGVLVAGNVSQLEVRRATINHRAAQCLYLHPPAALRFKLPVAGAGRFTTAIAIQPEAWDQPTAGGCEFSLFLNGREVFRKAINPSRVSAHRCWHEVAIEVPTSDDGFHEFIFHTSAIGTPPDFRWALWRDPVFQQRADDDTKPL